jgi:methyl-accepting chemotaxis protein
VGQLADQAARFKVGRTAAVRRPAPAATRAPAYTSPVRALPAAPVPALVGADDDWKEF